MHAGRIYNFRIRKNLLDLVPGHGAVVCNSAHTDYGVITSVRKTNAPVRGPAPSVHREMRALRCGVAVVIFTLPRSPFERSSLAGVAYSWERGKATLSWGRSCTRQCSDTRSLVLLLVPWPPENASLLVQQGMNVDVRVQHLQQRRRSQNTRLADRRFARQECSRGGSSTLGDRLGGTLHYCSDLNNTKSHLSTMAGATGVSSCP